METQVPTMQVWQLWLMFVINICLIIGFGWKAISVLVSFRDDVRDLIKAVGEQNPATGLFLDVEKLWSELRGQRRELSYHRDTLITLTQKEGLPPPGGRT